MTESVDAPRIRQRPEGLRGKFVGKTLAFALAIAVLAVIVSAALHFSWAGKFSGPPLPEYPVAQTVGGIHQRLLDSEPRGLAKKAAAQHALTEYGVVDSHRNVVRIPIDRAMDWLVDDARRNELSFPDRASVLDAGVAGPSGRR